MYIHDLFDNANYFRTIHGMCWPNCLACDSAFVVNSSRDDIQDNRQRYVCKGYHVPFVDQTGTVFADHHLPLRTLIACL